MDGSDRRDEKEKEDIESDGRVQTQVTGSPRACLPYTATTTCDRCYHHHNHDATLSGEMTVAEADR